MYDRDWLNSKPSHMAGLEKRREEKPAYVPAIRLLDRLLVGAPEERIQGRLNIRHPLGRIRRRAHHSLHSLLLPVSSRHNCEFPIVTNFSSHRLTGLSSHLSKIPPLSQNPPLPTMPLSTLRRNSSYTKCSCIRSTAELLHPKRRGEKVETTGIATA